MKIQSKSWTVILSRSQWWNLIKQYHASFERSSRRSYNPSIMDYAYANWSLSVSMWWDAIAFALRKKGLRLFVHGNFDIKKSTFGEK